MDKIIVHHSPPASVSNSIPDEFTQAPVQSFGEQLNRKRKLPSDDDDSEDLVNELLADSGDEKTEDNGQMDSNNTMTVVESEEKSSSKTWDMCE